jgi:hypothetical protein
MKLRFRTALFFLVWSAALALGIFLLIAADETPAPGLILIGMCGISLILYFRRTSHQSPPRRSTDYVGPSAIERDREAYEQEQERRRGEPSDW